MPVRVFGLRGVPFDEAVGVRDALAEAGIEFYETPAPTPGYEGKSPGDAAIWVVSQDEAAAARVVIQRFQADWSRQAREEATLAGVRSTNEGSCLGKLIVAAAVAMLVWVFFLASGRI
jgi:hypothetical protein